MRVGRLRYGRAGPPLRHPLAAVITPKPRIGLPCAGPGDEAGPAVLPTHDTRRPSAR